MNRRVVVRAPNPLGDAVMALSALAVIAQEAELAVLARPSVAALFSGYRVVELQGRWDGGGWEKADQAIILPNSFAPAFTAWRAGVPERIGYAMHWRSWLLTRALPRPSLRTHQGEWYLDLARAAGFTGEAAPPRLAAPSARPWGEGYVALAPGGAYGEAKRWPGFAELAAELLRQGRRIVVLGGAGEGRDLPQDDALIDLTGRTTLEEALAALAGAAAVVANDSGLAHAAAALGRPTVVLFGPSDPAHTLPPGARVIHHEFACAPCHLRRCPLDHRCMRAITTAEVMKRLPA